MTLQRFGLGTALVRGFPRCLPLGQAQAYLCDGKVLDKRGA
jgi:hypothetical protein